MKKLLRVAAIIGVLGLIFLLTPPANASFCNQQGFLVCDTADGTSCGLEGQNRRCIAPGVCEWGICRCQGGTWNCIY